MNSPYWPIEEIDDRLRENVGELVEHVLDQPPNRKLSIKDTLRFGNKGGIAVEISGPDRGRITPFDGDGKGRSPLKFIQEQYDLSFFDALNWAAHWLRLPPGYKPDSGVERHRRERRKRKQREFEVLEAANRAKRIAQAVEIYDGARGAAGTPVETYLAGRGITTALPDDVRFIPATYSTYAAMVMAARDNFGNVQAVQRVFIQHGKKASIETAKRTNGPMDGAAVRLPGKRGDELVLAEGPETGLSVSQAWGRETWVALGSVAKLTDILPIGRPIVIARDADAPGSPADKALMKAILAMTERGLNVRVVSPPNPTKMGYDFNDALMDYGNEAVANSLEYGNQIKPRYPAPTMTVQEARKAVHIAFSAWTKSLSSYWHRKAAHKSHVENMAGVPA